MHYRDDESSRLKSMIVHTDLLCLIVCIFHMQPQYLSNDFCQLTIIPHARCRRVNMIYKCKVMYSPNIWISGSKFFNLGS